MKKLLNALSVLMMVAILAACGSNNGAASAPAPTNNTAAGGPEAEVKAPVKTELKMALTVDPDGLDPHRTTAASTFQITNNLYDTLVKVSSDGEFVPGLAEEWKVSEDGLTIAFKLREGVKFHNGREMTAEDVKFSFERLKGEESPRAGDFANIVSITAVDNYNIEFATKALDVALVSQFAYPWTAIVPEEAVEQLRNNPVGTGPFKLEQWVPQQQIVLTRNNDYFTPAKLEKVSFIMMPDATSQITALQSGELDIINVSGDAVPQFENNSEYSIIETQANAVQVMAMNLDNEALSDARVRQAINYAVDKQALIDTVWWGYGQEIGSHYPPMLKEYLDTNEAITYDPEKAKQLLEEAGYAQGLTLEMYLPSSYPNYVAAGQVIADQLKKIGLTINIHTVEWGFWLSDVYTGRKYDLTVTGHTGRLDPYALLARYHSESKENYMNYKNERVDEILTQVQQERDEQQRLKLYQELQQILAEDVPALYIQSPIGLTVTAANVAGYQSYPIDIYEMKDVYFTN